MHEENIISKHNQHSMLKLKKTDSPDAESRGNALSPASKDKEYTDEEFFKIEERPRKRSIKKSFKRLQKRKQSTKQIEDANKAPF